jgi:hypothetical protein
MGGRGLRFFVQHKVLNLLFYHVIPELLILPEESWVVCGYTLALVPYLDIGPAPKNIKPLTSTS